MAAKPLPDAELLRKLLRYEPETGKLFWKERPLDMFRDGAWNSAYRKCCSWNGKNAGMEALCSKTSHGYLAGAIFGRSVRAHRVIWKMMTDEDAICIDHIDGCRTNNRWSNLRSVTPAENCSNSARYRSNTTGITGVYVDGERWRASITINRKNRYLGIFETKEDAMMARKAAEREIGFHPNHGRPGK